MAPSVTFNDQVKLDLFDQIEEFERILIWWGPTDYARFRAVCTKTVQNLLGRDECDGDNFYCMRGLESWGSNGSRERRTRIKAATTVVLEGQQKLREDNDKDGIVVDGFAMAQLYQQETHQDQVQARLRGAQDEEEQLRERIKNGDEVPGRYSPGKGSHKTGMILPAARIKRRRSSEGKLKNQSLGLSLKNFARKITSYPAA